MSQCSKHQTADCQDCLEDMHQSVEEARLDREEAYAQDRANRLRIAKRKIERQIKDDPTT